MLYPRESETREIKELNGLWNFSRKSDGPDKPLTPEMEMAVPASYNNLTQDASLRDHIGDVWYEREFFIPASWTDRRILLRFGAVSHHAECFLDGEKICEHKGGFLPFAAEITDQASPGKSHRLTVKVNNILDWQTLPPGEIKETSDCGHPPGYRKQVYHFDFFNFAGIHRPVQLLSLPGSYIEDISVKTSMDGTDGSITYNISVNGEGAEPVAILKDEAGAVCAEGSGASGDTCCKGC
jgi:beta-glucuronidase